VCVGVLFFQVRDYIHVLDLAAGHIQALHKLFNTPDIGKGFVIRLHHFELVLLMVFLELKKLQEIYKGMLNVG
jgi:hypothetical protein